MSFTPIQFTYTPPATVNPAPIETIPTTNTLGASSINGILQPVKAQEAINALKDLVDTSKYLQSLILAIYARTGVTIDPNSDPATAQALESCYGLVPPIVTTAMYSNLLDCQLGLQSIDSAAGNNSTIQADPFMMSNVTQINNAVSNALLTDGGSGELAIQSLAFLKSDSLIFSNLASSLSVYQPGTDLSPSVASNLNTLINNEQGLLASLYSLQTTANVVNQDINNVINNCLVQPLEDIVRITAALNLMKSLTLKDEAKKIFDGLSTVVYSRLLSEVGVGYFAADQIAQRVLNPLKNMTGSIGSIVNSVNSSVKSVEKATNLAKTTASSLSQQGLKGFSNCNSCTQNVLKTQSGSKLPNVPGYGALSKGLVTLGQHILAAQSAMSNKLNSIEAAFIALQKRKNKDFADILQIMCAMQSAESLINIGKQIISNPSSAATSIASNVAPSANLVTLSAASSTPTASTSSTSTKTSTSVTTLPAIPTNVRTVLIAGGATIGEAHA